MEKPHIPGLLVSMPNLDDPYFGKSVILLCDYNQETAFGVMINRPSMVRVIDLFDEARPNLRDIPLMVGGPVQPDFFWAVHSTDYEGKNTSVLNDQVAISSLADVLEGLQEDGGPSTYHFGCGYAGWSPGQLDEELKEGAWWLAPMDNALVLESPYDNRWQSVVRDLGMDPDSTVFPTSGEA